MLKQEGVHFVFCPKQGNKMDREMSTSAVEKLVFY